MAKKLGKSASKALKSLAWQNQLQIIQNSNTQKGKEIQLKTQKTNNKLLITNAEGDKIGIVKKGKPKWQKSWLKNIDANNLLGTAIEIHENNTETILDAYEIYSVAKDNEFGYEIGIANRKLSTPVFGQDGKMIGMIKTTGFSPSRKGKNLWKDAQRIAAGSLSQEEMQDLSKPALRALTNVSYLINEKPGFPNATQSNKEDAELELIRKDGDSLFGNLDDLLEGLVLDPDEVVVNWGGTFRGREWILTQNSPSIIGDILDKRHWFGAINAGRPFRMASDPLNPNNLITYLEHAGLWHSIDGGESWEQVSDQDLGADAAPNNFSHLAAYSLPGEQETLMLAFVGKGHGAKVRDYKRIGERNADNSLNTLISNDSGVTWERNTSISNSIVHESIQLDEKLILADTNGLKIFDISNGWGELLTGNSESSIALTGIEQLKTIPNNNEKIIAKLSKNAGNRIYLIDLSNGNLSQIGRPSTANNARHSEIDTADLGDNTFRLYYFGTPRKELPNETAQPGLATVYSIDLDQNLTESTTSDIDASGTGQPDHTAWVAWGYPETNPADGSTIFRNSVRDALDPAGGGHQWFHTIELLADQTFPDKAYIGGTTLGYVLHPSVDTNNPEERGANMHWDPAGWNSYVREKYGSDNAGSSELNSALFHFIAELSDDEELKSHLERIESGENKTHADAQMLYSDGSYLYYGTDGGLLRTEINPDGDTTSKTLRALGINYTWDEFKDDLVTQDFPIFVNGLESLPTLGFYQPNWETLNKDLISNLYQGGSLSEDGSLWITGAQDNGISIGSNPNSSPYLITNADGGAGFFGNNNSEVAWTTQFTSLEMYNLVGELSPNTEASAVKERLWTRRGGEWTGTLSSNLIANLFDTNSVLIKFPGIPLNLSKTISDIQSFFVTRDGAKAIFPRSNGTMRRNLDGEEVNVDEINVKWINYDQAQLSRRQASRELSETLNSEGASLDDLNNMLSRYNGSLNVEIVRSDSEKEHIRLSIEALNGGSLGLGIASKISNIPQISLSLDGGDSWSGTYYPSHSSGATFYFPAEQHPLKRETVGISDGKRIYIYHDIFNALRSIRDDYTSTVDLNQLQKDFLGNPLDSSLKAFAFAPWDQTGQTLLCGFSNGKTLLIRNALVSSGEPIVEQVGFANGSVNSVEFSSHDEQTYRNTNDGFFVISHNGVLLPEIVKYENNLAIADPNFNTGTGRGSSLDSIVANEERIYTATTDGVYEMRLATGNWQKIGGNYRDNLPTTRVHNLAFNDSSDRLYAFTYGRGVYYYDIDRTFHPDVHIWDLPHIFEIEGQYVPPPDLVTILEGLDDPRIRNAAQFIETKKDGVNVGIPPLSANDSLRINPRNLAKSGDYFNIKKSDFMQSKDLQKQLTFFADATIRKNGKSIKTLSLQTGLNTISGNRKNDQVSATSIDLSKAIHFIDQKFGKNYADASLVIDTGFYYGKNKDKNITSRKLINFSPSNQDRSESISLENNYIADYTKNRKRLNIFSNEWTDPSTRLKDITEVIPLKATQNHLTSIPTPKGAGRITGQIFEISKGNIKSKAIETITANQGNQFWWHPESTGDFLLTVTDQKNNSLATYEIEVVAKSSDTGESNFPSRLKGFEQQIIGQIDFGSKATNSLEKLLRNEGLESIPLSQNIDDDDLLQLSYKVGMMKGGLTGKEMLDAVSLSNDFLIDYADFQTLRKSESSEKIFYSSVDWSEVDYSSLSPDRVKLIDWNKVDLKEANQSDTFNENHLDIDTKFFL